MILEEGPFDFFVFCMVDQMQYGAIFDDRFKENVSQGIPVY